MTDFKTLSPDKALKFKLFLKYDLWAYLLVIACICVCSYIFDKWLEGIAFCVAHTFIRYKMNYVYHSRHYCMVITLTIVWLCIPSVTTVNLSLLSSIPIAIFICWIGSKAQESKVLRRKNSKLNIDNAKLQEMLKPKQFNIDDCTIDELLERCAELHLSEKNTEMALELFIYKTRHKELADKYCIDEHAVAKQKLRLKKKLNKPQ